MRYRLFALLLTAVAIPASAQSVPKIPFTRDTLPNGLEVILHEDHSVPLVAVNAVIAYGLTKIRAAAQIGHGMLISCIAAPLSLALAFGAIIVFGAAEPL